MAASLALTLGAGAGAEVLAPFVSAPAYATATGERRSVRLPDGTVVELNTHSRIIVRYSGRRRAIRLVRGEAVFHVAKDPRPFLVQTRAADVDTQHADVDVRLAGQSTRLSVQAGHALAQPLGTTAGSVTMAANEIAVFGPAGIIVQKVSADDMDRALAWRRGVIALNGDTLADAVEELNRYNRRKIKVADPSIASLHLGGYFNVDDVEGFADAVTRTFPVVVILSPDGELLMKHRAAVRGSATLKS
ncbi:MAG: FecR family protein [Caulobacteraceae bacterium]